MADADSDILANRRCAVKSGHQLAGATCTFSPVSNLAHCDCCLHETSGSLDWLKDQPLFGAVGSVPSVLHSSHLFLRSNGEDDGDGA